AWARGTSDGAVRDQAIPPAPGGRQGDHSEDRPGVGTPCSMMPPPPVGRIPTLTVPRRNDCDLSWYGTLGMLAACLGVLATLLFSGCSGPGHAHDVDAPRAREALKTALDQWKKGEGPKSLESSSTPMTVQDFDLAAGAKLLDYQIVDDGKEADANLRVQVKLVLSSPGKDKGKSAEKKVWYVVGTSPSVTVFRDALRR